MKRRTKLLAIWLAVVIVATIVIVAMADWYIHRTVDDAVEALAQVGSKFTQAMSEFEFHIELPHYGKPFVDQP